MKNRYCERFKLCMGYSHVVDPGGARIWVVFNAGGGNVIIVLLMSQQFDC